MTKSEVILLNQMVGNHIADWEEKEKLPAAKYKLQKDLIKVEEWMDEKIQEAVNDKRISEEGSEKQTKMETSQRICTPCED